MSGTTEENSCLSYEDEQHYHDYQVRIAKEQYWFRERLLDAETDAVIKQIADFSWHQLERVRWFACMIDFPGEPGGLPNVTHHYIKIHDQGGAFSFAHADGRPMILTMRNTWSYGMQRESFVIAVQEGDESGRTIVYSWGSPNSDRIGLNPGHMRVQCDLDTPKNVKMQNWLRPNS